jgi:hypothetical protein
MDETGISLRFDREWKYKQSQDFKTLPNPGNLACDAVLNQPAAKAYTDSDGFKHCFYYPDDDKTQYLYEMYPQISPLKGVTDEHFIVWMRTASLPNFRKLYGVIPGGFRKGDVIAFNVTANFEVQSFDGTKSLILSTKGQFGSKNTDLGTTYLAVGALSIFAGFVFLGYTAMFPRVFGDSALLPAEWLKAS